MRASLTYPIKSSFHLDEHWPILLSDMVITLTVEDGAIRSVNCEWALTADDSPPRLRPLQPGQTGFGGVDFHLHRRPEIETVLRTVQGLLSVDGLLIIDFEHPTLTWIADSEEEDMGIDLVLRASPPAPDPFAPTIVDFDMVARSFAAAPSAASHEIPLSFLRRGRRAFREQRYIEAFYDNFFFLETLFAAGYSKPKEVASRLLAAPLVVRGLALIRRDPPDPPVGFQTELTIGFWEQRTVFLDRDDAEILQELVALRGNLHHHAYRHPATWHPDKTHPFRVASHVLHDLAIAVADGLFADKVLSDDHWEMLLRSAEAAGAIVTLRVDAKGIFKKANAMTASLKVRLPGRTVTRRLVESADRAFRAWVVDQGQDATVFEYAITNERDGRVYGRYKRERIIPLS
jgi:hypothetical protein